MSEEKKKKTAAKEVEANTEPTIQEEPQPVETDEIAELTARAEAAEKALAEAKDALLRTAAEYDNFRKRSQREKDAIHGESVATTIADFLPVIDNLDRALACNEDSALRQGLELTARQLHAVLEKMNISAIDPKGEAFDPNLHNAVMHTEDPELGESVVAEVLQKGYLMGDRVIRFAMVSVAN